MKKSILFKSIFIVSILINYTCVYQSKETKKILSGIDSVNVDIDIPVYLLDGKISTKKIVYQALKDGSIEIQEREDADKEVILKYGEMARNGLLIFRTK